VSNANDSEPHFAPFSVLRAFALLMSFAIQKKENVHAKATILLPRKWEKKIEVQQ
jgi:hypothetical protein